MNHIFPNSLILDNLSSISQEINKFLNKHIFNYIKNDILFINNNDNQSVNLFNSNFVNDLKRLNNIIRNEEKTSRNNSDVNNTSTNYNNINSNNITKQENILVNHYIINKNN